MKKKKLATVVIQEEIICSAVQDALEKVGCDVSLDMEQAKDSDFAVVATYCYQLGVVNFLKKLNPLLPIVLVARETEIRTGEVVPSPDLYDTIVVQNHDQERISLKIRNWFLNGEGRYLLEKPKTKGGVS